jgi:pyruvate, water dikinase
VNTAVERRFPGPLDVPTPPGAEGWQGMYSPYLLFSEENATWEASLFWYWDGMHRPDVEYPFDTIVHEAYMMSVSAVVSRIFAVPGDQSAASRVLNGRLYLTDVPFTDPAEQERRMPIFLRRAGHYFEHWSELNDNWIAKLETLIAELAAVEIADLPGLEDESVVLSGRGFSSAYVLLRSYEEIVQNLFLAYQYHFEMLLLAYAAQINLQEFVATALSGLTPQTLAKLTGGVELRQFGPDEQLKGLARQAIELGLGDRLRASGPPETLLAQLADDPAGREWADALEQAKDPWFHVSAGTGLFHNERAWIDDLSVPFAAITGYIERLERGEMIDRPQGELLRERDRLAAEYRDLLASDADRETFDQNLDLARLVAPHLQDHNFYIEHRHHTIFWNKMRALADRVVARGLLDQQDDLFFLNRWEVGQVLFDTANSWAQTSPGRGAHWRSLVSRRREIVQALAADIPEPALGAVPTSIGGVVSAQFGITLDTVEQWLGPRGEQDGVLRGVAASGGVAEGPARVVLSSDEIGEVRSGEILVCPSTAPAWAPVFGKIKATVSDVGGIMCHAAILCREYGIPAVLGTGIATRQIRTGDLVRVNGDDGTVTVLARASAD